MNILFNFINHTTAIDNTDYRINTFKPLLYNMQKAGHHVFIDPHKRSGHPSIKPFKKLLKDFPIFSDKNAKDIQLWIVPYAYAKRKKRYTYFRKKIPIIIYEHGWLYQSVFVDRGELFSDSYFTQSISDLIKDNFNAEQCATYQTYLLKRQASKRPQTGVWQVPKDIDKTYIFIPVQKIDDISVSNYSKTGMLDFITQTVAFSNKNNITIIIKQHPHATEDHDRIKKHVKNLKKTYKAIYIVEAPIYYLMQHARFTACVNSGSVVDNFVTQTPVFCCGKSFFYKSECLTFNSNVKQGLEIMLQQNYDWNSMRQKQLKMLWWLKNNLLFPDLTAQENMIRLQKNSMIPSL